MNKYSEILMAFPVQNVSIVENALGIEFKPSFHLVNTLKNDQVSLLKRTLRWALDTTFSEEPEWISLASKEIVIGCKDSILIVESIGEVTHYDFRKEVLVSVNNFESWNQPCLELNIQPTRGEHNDLIWKHILHFHGGGGHKVRSKVLQELRPSSRVVVAVFGAPGVGKSTLVNSVIGDDVALVTTGKPGTAETTWYESSDRKWALVDTEGWNGQESTLDAFKRISAEIDFCGKSGNGFAFDVIWYCVSHRVGKLMEGEQNLIRDIQSIHGVRVFLVSLMSPEIIDKEDDFVKAVSRRRGKQKETFYVNAKDFRKGFTFIPSHGLDNLLDATRKAVGRN